MDTRTDVQAQDVPGDQEQEAPAVEGEAEEVADEPAKATEEAQGEDLPVYVKERLGRQEKRHQKQLRAMQEQLQGLQSHVMASQQGIGQSQAEAQEVPSTEDERIQRAVGLALSHKDRLDSQAKEAERHKHVAKQYQRLQDDLDKASDKYDDFDEVVRGQDAPYTEAMRDAALLLPNPADVLYKLGQNPNELKRISELHPLEQAKEMLKLSIALHSGATKPEAKANIASPIKTRPVSSSQITDKTPISELRKRFKDLNWSR